MDWRGYCWSRHNAPWPEKYELAKKIWEVFKSLSMGRVGSTKYWIVSTTLSMNSSFGNDAWKETGGCFRDTTLSSNNHMTYPIFGKWWVRCSFMHNLQGIGYKFLTLIFLEHCNQYKVVMSHPSSKQTKASSLGNPSSNRGRMWHSQHYFLSV